MSFGKVRYGCAIEERKLMDFGQNIGNIVVLTINSANSIHCASLTYMLADLEGPRPVELNDEFLTTFPTWF